VSRSNREHGTIKALKIGSKSNSSKTNADFIDLTNMVARQNPCIRLRGRGCAKTPARLVASFTVLDTYIILFSSSSRNLLLGDTHPRLDRVSTVLCTSATGKLRVDQSFTNKQTSLLTSPLKQMFNHVITSKHRSSAHVG